MTMLREMMMLMRPLSMLKRTDVVEDEYEDIAKEV